MHTAGVAISYALYAFTLVLLFRLVMDWVFVFARSYRPRGAMVVVLEAVYSITDPPLRFLRRFIPPIRLGTIALDVAFMALFFLVAVIGPYLVARFLE